MHNLNVQHDIINGLFFAKVKGGMARLLYKKAGNTHLELKEIHVPSASRGMGVSRHLIESALEYARERGMVIKSESSLVKEIIESSNAYRHLLVRN